MNDFKPSLSLRKKNVQLFIDFCIDTRQEFSLIPKGNDEFTAEIKLASYQQAIVLGIFLKENKLECSGISAWVPASRESVVKTKSEKSTTKESVQESPALPLDSSPAFAFENN